MIRRDLHPLFKVYKPLIAMIHLAGRGINEIDSRAMQEIELFEREGVNGIIVEDYHGDESDAERMLRNLQRRGTSLAVGVNLLSNNPERTFSIAQRYGASFIQLDYVAGTYSNRKPFSLQAYDFVRGDNLEIAVLGGVWFKGCFPVLGSSLVDDLKEGVRRADAIVVTGEGTGLETPMDKILQYRRITLGHTLLVGAGLTPENTYEQMQIADGAIVGSGLKRDGRTENEVELSRVRKYTAIFEQIRKERKEKHFEDAPDRLLS